MVDQFTKPCHLPPGPERRSTSSSSGVQEEFSSYSTDHKRDIFPHEIDIDRSSENALNILNDEEDGVLVPDEGSREVEDHNDNDHDDNNIESDKENYDNDEDAWNEDSEDEHDHEMSEFSCADIDQSSVIEPDYLSSHQSIQHSHQPNLFTIHHLSSRRMSHQQPSVQFSSTYILDRFFRIDQRTEPLRHEANIAMTENRISQGDRMFLRRLEGIIQGDSENESFGRPNAFGGEAYEQETVCTTIRYSY